MNKQKLEQFFDAGYDYDYYLRIYKRTPTC